MSRPLCFSANRGSRTPKQRLSVNARARWAAVWIRVNPPCSSVQSSISPKARSATSTTANEPTQRFWRDHLVAAEMSIQPASVQRRVVKGRRGRLSVDSVKFVQESSVVAAEAGWSGRRGLVAGGFRIWGLEDRGQQKTLNPSLGPTMIRYCAMTNSERRKAFISTF